MKVYSGMEVWLHTFLTLELDGSDWLSSRHSRFNKGKGLRYPSDSLRVPHSPYGRFVGETNRASVRSRTMTPRTSIQYVGYYLSPIVMNSINEMNFL